MPSSSHSENGLVHSEGMLPETEGGLKRCFGFELTGMARTSPTKGYLEVNDRMCTFLGYQRRELLNMTWTELSHPDDLAAEDAHFNRVLAGEFEGYSMDKRWIRKDGQVIHSSMSVKCLRRTDGSVESFMALVHDITARKCGEDALRRAQDALEQRVSEWTHQLEIRTKELSREVLERKRIEEKLRKSEGRFRLLAEAIPHHVCRYRLDGSLSDVNRRLIDYTGLTTNELQAGGWAALHPDDLEQVQTAWREAGTKDTPYEFEQRLRGRDGCHRHFLCRAIPIHDEQGHLVEWFATNTDMEDRKQAEAALHKAQAELAHVTRLLTVGELAASIGHEVNQPLAAIVTNGQTCLRWLASTSPDLGAVGEAVADMVKDANRASDVIARIRELVQKRTPQSVWLDANDLIRDVITLVHHDVLRKQVSLRTALCPELPSVLADRVQLQQVLLNLILNGIEAMSAVPDQAHELSLQSSRHDSGDVLIAVQDAGVGLDPNKLEQIFAPFVTTKPNGMGMGLAISRSIVEAHGGRLWATNNEGRGATFHFTLPLRDRPMI